jgi:hypothetical protein
MFALRCVTLLWRREVPFADGWGSFLTTAVEPLAIVERG